MMDLTTEIADIFVPQTTPFTCGPVAGLMALRLSGVLERSSWTDEFQLWREANSVFMGGGQAGCESDGLAVALKRRGADVVVWERFTDALFDAWTRSTEKRAVIRLIRDSDRNASEAAGIASMDSLFSWETFADHVRYGWVPVVLIRDGGVLHWVTVSRIVGGDLEYLDPFISGSPKDLGCRPNVRTVSLGKAPGLMTHRRGTAHAIIFIRKPVAG